MTHHHPAHHPHPAQIGRGPSFFRLSAVQRLALAGAVIAFLWGAIFWAMA